MTMAMVTMMMALLLATSASASSPSPTPSPTASAAKARWLASRNIWGVISTTHVNLSGIAWGNIASYSDGPLGKSTGTPYFYLSTEDPTPQDIASNSSCSFTLSEEPLGSCGTLDPENPTCARLILSGEMKFVTGEQDLQFANISLFSKHPEMPYWPPMHHNWTFYKLEIEQIFLLDAYGPSKNLTKSEYYYDRPVQTAVDH